MQIIEQFLQEIEIVELSEKHTKAVARLHHQGFPFVKKYHSSYYREYLKNKEVWLSIGTFIKDKLIGYCIINIKKGEAEKTLIRYRIPGNHKPEVQIDYLCINKKYYRKGYARKFLEHCQKLFSSILVHTTTEGKPLYKSLGFKNIDPTKAKQFLFWKK